MLPPRYPARHATCSGSVLFPAVTAPGASGASARSTANSVKTKEEVYGRKLTDAEVADLKAKVTKLMAM